MNKLKYSAYSLIVISIIKIGLLIPVRQLGEQINEMEIRYSEMKFKSERISAFEDSLIYNPNFRTRTLGTRFRKEQLDSAIAENKWQALQTIKEIEILHDDRIELSRNFKILSGIDSLTELLIALSAGLTIYYWIKLKK